MRTIALTMPTITRSFIVAIVAVFALFVSTTLSAQAAVTENYRVQVSGGVVDTCNGTLVSLTGNLHVLSRTTTNANGGLSTGGLFTLQMQGIGADGTKYVVSAPQTSQYTANGATQQSSQNQFVLVSQGGAPNMTVKYDFHWTVDANGEVTATPTNFRAVCTGS